MIRLLPPTPLKLAGCFPRPTLAPLVARHDPLGVKLDLLLVRSRLRFGLPLLILARLARTLLASAPEELGAALPRAQLLRQLIPALLAIQLILGLIGRLRLRQDLAGDLLKVAS